MNPSQKQAIEAKAEELYPWNADSYINFNVQQSKEHWIQGATFGLSLAEKRIAELEEELHPYKVMALLNQKCDHDILEIRTITSGSIGICGKCNKWIKL